MVMAFGIYLPYRPREAESGGRCNQLHCCGAAELLRATDRLRRHLHAVVASPADGAAPVECTYTCVCREVRWILLLTVFSTRNMAGNISHQTKHTPE